jgi:serine/threonine protein kinase
MLTGALPFVAADPLEWVHCHIARQPVAPADRRAVPEPLSAIIMKLLAKNAEDRYQTAAGLEADLRRCLTEWQSHVRIDSFPLATDDSSGRLLIPEKLYGRENRTSYVASPTTGAIGGSHFYFMENTHIDDFKDGKIVDPKILDPVRIGELDLGE